jgi:hypothetical protein
MTHWLQGSSAPTIMSRHPTLRRILTGIRIASITRWCTLTPRVSLFLLFQTLAVSKKGGLSIGISFVFGIPSGASVQFGGGYNFKFMTFMVMLVSPLLSILLHFNFFSNRWSAGYTAGASILGIPSEFEFPYSRGQLQHYP